jgi:release factor glutamine methyltransferase
VRGLPAGCFDLVAANLPYVPEPEWEGLEPELRLYEPRDALVAGADGLDAIRELIARAPAGTAVALEHGSEQGPAVRGLLTGSRTLADLAGRDRVTTGRVP